MTFKYSLEDYIKQAEENKGSSLTFRERQEVKKNYKKAYTYLHKMEKEFNRKISSMEKQINRTARQTGLDI